MITIIAELATNHGGDVGLAAEMIQAAAASGATYAKLQSYSLEALNPRDPQADWLRTAHLDRGAHERLIQVGIDAGIPVISTPFDAASLQMLRELGLTTFKIASSESGNEWWQPQIRESWFVSYPWGNRTGALQRYETPWLTAALTAIPLYPTPLECVGRAALLDGWSDHTEGTAACYWALSHGATVIEVHFTIGKGRVCSWDKSPEMLREIRDFADKMEIIHTGVSTQFRERWRR